jgi:hypothetical protein
MIPVPVLSPWLSARWLGLITPLYARVGRKMLDSVRNPTVVEDDRALEVFPVRPRGIAEAVERALRSEDRIIAETRWSDALSSKGAARSWAGTKFLSRIVDSRTIHVDRAPAEAFAPIRRIGGEVGWYYGDWLWRIRGFLDLLVGGAGTRRGRRDPEHARPGDTIDFWRVETVVLVRALPRARVRLQGNARRNRARDRRCAAACIPTFRLGPGYRPHRGLTGLEPPGRDCRPTEAPYARAGRPACPTASPT